MTGLKSGSGDDLWGDDEESGDEGREAGEEASEGPESERAEETAGAADPADANATGGDGETADGPESASGDGDDASGSGASSATQPYIVRRAVRDKSVQFERDERLTFFVHDDVADGERELLTELESALGRGVPKFDVREAVYRAALRNPDDVLDELLDMGYSLDEDRE